MQRAGLRFVEVGFNSWNTHLENNDAVRKLCGQLDPALSILVDDLHVRGLIDDTLIIWMGEFGRTPRFNGKGRDHFARAWSTVLMGGGLKGGQVVGHTNAEGARVQDRPTSVANRGHSVPIDSLLACDFD